MGIFRSRAERGRRHGDRRTEPQLFSDRTARANLRKTRRRPLVFRLFGWAVTLSVWAVVVLAGLTAYVWFSLDTKSLFRIPEREPGMIVLAANGDVIAERGAFFGDEVRLDELPVYLPQAVIAIEDRRFHNHFGIDPVGLARAMMANYRAGRIVEGGSTLSQQLAKNLFLDPERTVKRKLQEAVLALWLEAKFSKEEILQLYLNRVYFGAGATGVEKAAQRFFSKSARDVSLSEAAILAGVLRAPSVLNPINSQRQSQARAEQVLRAMVEAGFVTAAEAEGALSAPAAVKSADYLPATQYVVDWVSEQLPDLVEHYDQSIIVETTIFHSLQILAEKAVRRRVNSEGGKLGVSQAAVVMMDMSGAVLAMVGGKSYLKSQFNRAVKARRQPGSAFKPFVYLTALEQGLTPETVEVDEPVRFGDWEPDNYRHKYQGPVTLTRALAQSLNSVAAKLAVNAGLENVVTTAHRLGINSELVANASLALGTSEVSLLEMTTAFTPFANGGRAVVPYVVTRISTRDGKVIYERQGSGLGVVIADADVGAMNLMLREVVRSGTGKRARIEGQDIAGKTGTSQNYRDAWFVGYSPYLVCGVWVGNDDNRPTRNVTGGALPADIWKDVMVPAHEGVEFAALPGDYQPAAATEFASDGSIFDAIGDLFGRGIARNEWSDAEQYGGRVQKRRAERIKRRLRRLTDK
jgi:penicillin-binding protein 1A